MRSATAPLADAGRSATADQERPTAAPSARSRIAGIDLARALAVLGMLAVHFGPTNLDDPAGQLYALPHGRASILFVFVAGVGVSLLAASRTSTLADARLRLLWRGALLLPLGLLLQALDHRVFVILQTYAALFLVAILVVGLPRRALLGLAVTLWFVGPVLYLLGRMTFPEAFGRVAVAWGDPAPRIAIGVLAAGPYPLSVWAAPFVTGMWIGRLDLRAPRVRVAVAAVGALLAIAAPWAAALLAAIFGEPGTAATWRALLLATPHSQMPFWLIGSIGSAALVLGVSLALADALPRATWPLVAVGQLALTVYVSHLLALHRWTDALRSRDVGEAAQAVLLFAVGAALVAMLWRALFRRGPLEALLDVPARATLALVQALGRRARAATAPAADLAHDGARRSTMDKLVLSDEEWRRRLTPEEFRVLRQHGTERPWEGCFLGTQEPGTYVCAACGQPLFASGEKFESGTGWPSFTQPLADDAVLEVDDRSYGMLRTEVRCARCDSHLGHVFPDGPPPTGLRYCMNSVAMKHVPEGKPLELVTA